MRRMYYFRNPVVKLEGSRSIDQTPMNSSFGIIVESRPNHAPYQAKLGNVFSTVLPRPPLCPYAEEL